MVPAWWAQMPKTQKHFCGVLTKQFCLWHTNSSPENLTGTLAPTNTKPCLNREQCSMCTATHVKCNANNFFQCKPYEKPASEGSEVEKYWKHWAWKYCMSLSHSKNFAGKPCWQPGWKRAFVTRQSPRSLCKHQPASLNTWNADFSLP